MYGTVVAWWLLGASVALALGASICSTALRRFSWAKFDGMNVTRTRQASVSRCVERSAAIETALVVATMLCVVAMTIALRALTAPRAEPMGMLDRRVLVWGSASAALAAVSVWALPALATRNRAEGVLALVAPLLAHLAAIMSPAPRPVPTREGGPEERPAGSSACRPAPAGAEQERAPAEEQAREILRSVLRSRNVDVSAIMTPRTEMVSVHAGATLEQARRLAVEQGHSRMPVFEENRDRIVGVLYVKDLLRCSTAEEFHAGKVSEIMHPAHFVPETKKVADLLAEFQRQQIHMAVVSDEYGGTAGVVTIEDAIEEVLGEIRDEYDEDERSPVRRVDETTAEVDAKVHVDQLNDALALDLPESDDYETLAGFITTALGRIPAVGESLETHGVRLTVIEADARKVDRVRLEMLHAEESR